MRRVNEKRPKGRWADRVDERFERVLTGYENSGQLGQNNWTEEYRRWRQKKSLEKKAGKKKSVIPICVGTVNNSENRTHGLLSCYFVIIFLIRACMC